MSENISPLDSGFYAAEDLGEHPPEDLVPGKLQIRVDSMRDSRSLEREVVSGKVADAIHRLHQLGKSVAADYSPGNITLIMSNNKTTIEKSTAAAVILAGGGIIYLLHKKGNAKRG